MLNVFPTSFCLIGLKLILIKLHLDWYSNANRKKLRFFLLSPPPHSIYIGQNIYCSFWVLSLLFSTPFGKLLCFLLVSNLTEYLLGDMGDLFTPSHVANRKFYYCLIFFDMHFITSFFLSCCCRKVLAHLWGSRLLTQQFTSTT